MAAPWSHAVVSERPHPCLGRGEWAPQPHTQAEMLPPDSQLGRWGGLPPTTSPSAEWCSHTVALRHAKIWVYRGNRLGAEQGRVSRARAGQSVLEQSVRARRHEPSWDHLNAASHHHLPSTDEAGRRRPHQGGTPVPVKSKVTRGVAQRHAGDSHHVRTCGYLHEPVVNPNTRVIKSLSTVDGGRR